MATQALQQKEALLKLSLRQAELRIQAIVNQPIPPMERTRTMRVWTYPRHWYDGGPIRPNFAMADIRTTQKAMYDEYEYVRSESNADWIYRGRDLEYNALTRYFYNDMTLPKKKLSETEMVEINTHFRTIARCERELAALVLASSGPPAAR